MQHSPTEAELSGMNTWCAEERLQYFLSRTLETEEVWSLGSHSGWELLEENGKSRVSLWPYQELARLNIPSDAYSTIPRATSLDNFFQVMLPMMIKQQIEVEILGLPGTQGERIEASRLYSIMEGMLDSGEYYLEG